MLYFVSRSFITKQLYKTGKKNMKKLTLFTLLATITTTGYSAVSGTEIAALSKLQKQIAAVDTKLETTKQEEETATDEKKACVAKKNCLKEEKKLKEAKNSKTARKVLNVKNKALKCMLNAQKSCGITEANKNKISADLDSQLKEELVVVNEKLKKVKEQLKTETKTKQNCAAKRNCFKQDKDLNSVKDDKSAENLLRIKKKALNCLEEAGQICKIIILSIDENKEILSEQSELLDKKASDAQSEGKKQNDENIQNIETIQELK